MNVHFRMAKFECTCRIPSQRLCRLLTFLATILLFTLKNSSSAENKLNLREPDRLKEYHARNYSWPLPHFVPDTPGWRRLMSRRFEQVERIPDVTSKEKSKTEERYWAWVGAMISALVVPNFTGESMFLFRGGKGAGFLIICSNELVFFLRIYCTHTHCQNIQKTQKLVGD